MDKLNELEILARAVVKNVQCRSYPIEQFLDAATPESILAIAKAFRELEQRAEAAEEKLAALAKQEPVGKFVFEPMGERWHHIKHGEAQHAEPKLPLVKLFTRPAPAAVPVDEIRAQGVDIMKAKILQTMQRSCDTFDKETWEIAEQVLLGIMDGCDVVAKELRTGTLPEKFRLNSDLVEGDH